MRRLLALAMTGGLLLAACGGSEGGTATPETTAPAAGSTQVTSDGSAGPTETTAGAPTSEAGGASTPEALQFDATTIDGTPLDLGAYAGRTVALWFWAPT